MLTKLKCFFVSKLFGATRAARMLGVQVGEGCRLYSLEFGTEPWLVSIGNNVTITRGVHLLTHDGSTWLIRDERGRRFRYARIEIGNNVFVGIRSILLPGVRVGDNVIIGAGSVVTKSIPSGVVVVGNPARIIGQFADYQARALATFATAADMVGRTFRERAESVVDRHPLPALTLPP